VAVLLEDPLGMTVPEKVNVGMEGMYVGEGCQKIGELGGIIPDPDFIREFFPSLEVIGKFYTTLLNGLAPIAFNGTKRYQHIACRPGLAGFARILIGQSGNHLVWKLLCHSIYKTNHGSTGRSLLLIDGRTMLTLAILGIVVLTHRNDIRIRIAFKVGSYGIDNYLQHLFVRKA
jgi:hypothetical protein